MGLEVSAQLGRVVDLAVVGNGEPPLVIVHGLGPGGGRVEDGQPSVSQACRQWALVVDPLTAAVGPAGGKGVSRFSERSLALQGAEDPHPAAHAG